MAMRCYCIQKIIRLQALRTLRMPMSILSTPPPENEPIQMLVDALHQGYSMEDIAKKFGSKNETPLDVLRTLELGNARFVLGKAQRPEKSAMERRSQIMNQSPFASILSCSDSRVPTEIIFDQGFGDLFVVRVAGNVITPPTLASLEYSITKLGIKVIVVLGHEGCGAVKAAMMEPEKIAQESPCIQELLSLIQPSVNAPYINRIRDFRSRYREAALANAAQQVKKLLESNIVKEAMATGNLEVVGGFYEISSGIVDLVKFN